MIFRITLIFILIFRLKAVEMRRFDIFEKTVYSVKIEPVSGNIYLIIIIINHTH